MPDLTAQALDVIGHDRRALLELARTRRRDRSIRRLRRELGAWLMQAGWSSRQIGLVLCRDGGTIRYLLSENTRADG